MEGEVDAVRILITGICGFVGSTIARTIRERMPGVGLIGIDNLSRRGSELNWRMLKALGVELRHADVRQPSDFEPLPAVDWVIDAAANPSVLAGRDGATSGRQLMEHNLVGTLNLLEYCRRDRAGLILLSTSRVYSIEPLSRLPVHVAEDAFVPAGAGLPEGVSAAGVSELFSAEPPLSLYGTSKRASELLALEYGSAFGFPVWINRCGVLAGAGQFGHAQQGIYSFWIHSWREKGPLRYIGFGGRGHQVRDCLHPRDLVDLMARQMAASSEAAGERIFNVSGGVESARSLAQLSAWCRARFGVHAVGADPEPRLYDVPWLVLDSRRVREAFGWRPQTAAEVIFEEIAVYAERNPQWIELSKG
jgi:CDP-paratose 2-epimerase